MNETPITLVDLDDTLFQTLRKCRGVPEAELVLVSESLNGSHSYMTAKQAAMVRWLIASTEVIPVTARGTEAFSKVKLPFWSDAIVANGAVIVGPEGVPDLEWDAIVRPRLAGFRTTLEDIEAAGKLRAAELGISVRGWIVEESGMGTYVVFKENNGDGSRLQEVAPVIGGEGWVRHHNGNNIALIPPVISKRLATEFLLRRKLASSPNRPVMGFGDSMSDMSYLSLCDWWGAPKVSQISDFIASAA